MRKLFGACAVNCKIYGYMEKCFYCQLSAVPTSGFFSSFLQWSKISPAHLRFGTLWTSRWKISVGQGK